MLSAKNTKLLQKINNLLPHVKSDEASAAICSHCSNVNETTYAFCTNCGYPLQNPQLREAYRKRLQQRNNFLFKSETAVSLARIVLYIIGAFLSLGIFFIFEKSDQKYFIVMLATILSGLFFFLAFWSRKNPFTALLTAFIILTVFSAVNIFEKLVQSFTTVQGITGMLLCLALLFVVLKGVQGAYRINLIKEELQIQ